jgi:RNA polymerase sigma-B factor
VIKPELAGRHLRPADRDTLVSKYMPLVSQIARRYSRFRPDLLEDLEQVGAIGLLKAIDYYDPARARVASFKTVASCYIKGEIRHYLRDHSSLVQVPRKLNEINNHIAQLEEMLSRELQRAPTLAELSERSGYSVQEICDAQRSWDACFHYESFDSRDEQDDRDDSRALSEMVADRKYQDFQLAEEDRELLIQALKCLGEKTRQIVEFVYFYDLTQKETAKKLGISEMGVSRAMRSAMTRLKDLLTTEIL